MAATSYQGDPTAVMGRRIGAHLIDGVLAFVVVLLFVVPMFQGLVDEQDFGTEERAEAACRVVNSQYGDADGDVNIDLFGDDPFCVNAGTSAYYLDGSD